MLVRFSMIDSFLSCPKCFYSRYILGKEDQVKSSAAEFGSALHAAIRAHFEDGDAYGVFNLYWDSLKDTEMIVYRYGWQELRDLANNKFLPNFIKLHAKNFTNYKMEETIEMPLVLTNAEGHKDPLLGSHTLQGTFDMCGEYKGTLTLTDWKTSSNDYKPSRVHRNHQLYVYCALYRSKYGVLPKEVMYKTFVKSKGSIQTTSAPVTEFILDLHLRNIEAILKNMLRVIETKEIYTNYNCFNERCLDAMENKTN